MFVNNVSADGFGSEGFGSALSFKLMSYGLSRALNLKYVDNQLLNIVGNTYENLEIDAYANELNSQFKFNYKNTVVSDKSPYEIYFDYPTKGKQSRLQFKILRSKRDLFFLLFKKNIEKIENKKYIKDLIKEREFSNRELYFKEGKNIVIHLRTPRQDIDVRFESSRNLFYGSYSDVDNINNTIRQIEHSEKDIKLSFHIVSTGTEKLFNNIDTMFDRNDIYLHLDTNIFDSFEMMLYADILRVCGSGLSYSAHLLNNNKVMVPVNTNFGKRAHYKNVISLDKEGLATKLNYKDKFF